MANKQEKEWQEFIDITKKCSDNIFKIIEKASICELDYKLDLAIKEFASQVFEHPYYKKHLKAIKTFITEPWGHIIPEPYSENKMGLLYYNVGNECMRQKKLALAIHCYQTALFVYELLIPSLLNNLGTAYKRTGFFDEALKYYYKAIEVDPLYFEGHFRIAQLIATYYPELTDKALYHLSEYFKIGGEIAVLKFHYLFHNIPENEAEALEELLEIFPEYLNKLKGESNDF